MTEYRIPKHTEIMIPLRNWSEPTDRYLPPEDRAYELINRMNASGKVVGELIEKRKTALNMFYDDRDTVIPMHVYMEQAGNRIEVLMFILPKHIAAPFSGIPFNFFFVRTELVTILHGRS